MTDKEIDFITGGNMQVKIEEFTTIGQDERGITQSFKTKDYGEFIYMTRIAGAVSGNTYHTGKNKGTNPKVFVLLSGEIELSYRTAGETHVVKNTILSPKVITIKPNVVHKIQAITDVTILENNCIEDIAGDRVRENVEIPGSS